MTHETVVVFLEVLMISNPRMDLLSSNVIQQR